MKTPAVLRAREGQSCGMDYWFKEDRRQGLIAGKRVEGEIVSVPPQEQVLGCEQPLLEKKSLRP